MFTWTDNSAMWQVLNGTPYTKNTESAIKYVVARLRGNDKDEANIEVNDDLPPHLL